jgi:hypothetical protein
MGDLFNISKKEDILNDVLSNFNIRPLNKSEQSFLNNFNDLPDELFYDYKMVSIASLYEKLRFINSFRYILEDITLTFINCIIETYHITSTKLILNNSISLSDKNLYNITCNFDSVTFTYNISINEVFIEPVIVE